MNKTKKLEKIAQEISMCRICKKDKVGIAVPGEGNPDARIVFLGEAPGKQEAKSGRPFIGRSGQLLRSFIRKSGLREDEVFITSPVKYLPIRGTPTEKEIQHGRGHLLKQLEIIQPNLIVLLGSVAVKGALNRSIPVKKEHGNIIKEKDTQYFITIHPAAALRFPALKTILLSDFKKLKKYL